MRNGVFGDGEHGENVAAEDGFDHVQVDFCKVFALGLLAGVVDEDVYLAVSERLVRAVMI